MDTITGSFKTCLEDERVLAGLTAAVVGLSMKALSQKQRRPPGPPVWPVLGSLPSFVNDGFMFKEFAEKYGDIYYLQLGLFGQNPTIVLSNMDLVREAFIKKPDDFAGRHPTHAFNIYTEQGSDVVFGDLSEVWKHQRKISHTALRKYISGNEFQNSIEHTADMIGNVFREAGGKPIAIGTHASIAFCTILSTLCFGKTYGMDDSEIHAIHGMFDDLNTAFFGFFLADMLPIFKYIPTPQISFIKKAADRLFKFINNCVAEHKTNFDENDVRDFTDYILQIDREMKASGECQVQLNDTHIRQLIVDMMFSGSDTSQLNLTWALMFTASHPEIQKKAHKEIDEQIGRDGKINTTTRMKLPYCEAILCETLRMRSPSYIGIPHATTCDTSVGGYDVPKGTQVLLNVIHIHSDPREWDNPEEFRPERFLDQDGNMAPKPNAFVPFSLGRRQCLGEAFAKAQTHILFGMLLQRFSFHVPEGKKIDFTPRKSLLLVVPKEGEDRLVVKER